MNRHLTAITALLALGLPVLQAQTVTWNGDDTGGDQIWTNPDSNSWTGGQYDNGDTAQFLGAGPGVITVDAGDVSPAAVTISGSATTLSPAVP